MFFIHGGAFYAGTQIKMGPERLGDVADIVLVAINYRVGPLGIDNIVIRLRIWLKA
jgi:carboxylesterase type B